MFFATGSFAGQRSVNSTGRDVFYGHGHVRMVVTQPIRGTLSHAMHQRIMDIDCQLGNSIASGRVSVVVGEYYAY